MPSTKLGEHAMTFPSGTTAQRPTAETGMLRHNTAGVGTMEYYSNSSWTTLSPILDGSSAAQAASNPQLIKNLTGTTTSGYYWILIGGTATQVWCDMSGATAWMLLMRFKSGSPSALNYTSSYWTNGSTGLNATSDPLTDIDIKNGALWNGYTITNLRITASTTATSYTSNQLTFGPFNTTAHTIFTSADRSWDGTIATGRSGWLNWLNSTTGQAQSNFDTQPNCNLDCVNNTNQYGSVRLGLVGNNEADCITVDSAVGIGITMSGYGGNAGSIGCGGISWTPNVATTASGWLWCN